MCNNVSNAITFTDKELKIRGLFRQGKIHRVGIRAYVVSSCLFSEAVGYDAEAIQETIDKVMCNKVMAL